MTHVEQGELQAYLDHEVSAGSRAEIDAHVYTCAACAAELDRLRAASSLFASVIKSSDSPAPVLAAYAALNRAPRAVSAPRRVPRSRSALARAAMILVGFAAVASAAIPGSPVRGWISDALRIVGVTPKADETVEQVVPEAQPVVRDERGGAAALSIQPVDGRVRILLTNVSPDATVRVRLVDGDRAMVAATGSASPRFRTGPGRIEVVGIEKGEVTVDIPRSAIDARVVVDGKVIFETRL